MAVEIALNTPLAEALSNVVQPKVSEVGWSTGGLDDSALGEYIILMLVNGKTQEQIASELSNDLLGLAPEDTGATEFAAWLFQQVELLNNQLNGGPPPRAQQQQQAQAPQLPEDQGLQIRGTGAPNGDTTAGNGVMGDATMEDVQDGGSIPTGPKSMRNSSRPGGKRLMGQLSKAMDRSGDSMLHRVRPQQGTERINMHNRQPPKGPRHDNMNRNIRMPPNGRGMPGGGQNGGAVGPLGQMSPQQQVQLMAMYEEQARMMSQIFNPQQFGMGMGGPAINPAFGGMPNQQPGPSLFDRVERNPHRQNGHFQKKPQQNGHDFNQHIKNEAMSNGGDSINGDPTSSMEVESSQHQLSPDTTCKFNLKCTKQDCPYAHQSPAAPAGAPIDVSDVCKFGAACQNRKCTGRHPSPAQKIAYQIEQECKFFPNCTNPNCTFRHPTTPVCKFGAACTRPDCKFIHANAPTKNCKFNPCLNAGCLFQHSEGQKRGKFGDKVWTADQDKEHVSDRKFVDDEMKDEELIVPGADVKAEDHGAGSQNSGTEVVT